MSGVIPTGARGFFQRLERLVFLTLQGLRTGEVVVRKGVLGVERDCRFEGNDRVVQLILHDVHDAEVVVGTGELGVECDSSFVGNDRVVQLVLPR